MLSFKQYINLTEKKEIDSISESLSFIVNNYSIIKQNNLSSSEGNVKTNFIL